LLEYQKGRGYYWEMVRLFSGRFKLPEMYRDRVDLQHLKNDEN
jgi:hypothetical protein